MRELGPKTPDSDRFRGLLIQDSQPSTVFSGRYFQSAWN